MSMQPAAHLRAGNVGRIRAFGSSLAFGAVSLLLTNTAFAAETAASVIKKMAEVYTKAKSFQGVITIQKSGRTPDGKTFTVTQTEHLQYQSPNMFHKTVKVTGTGAAATGPGAQALARAQGEVFSDGRNATMYVPTLKQYQKQPVPPSVQIAQLIDLLRQVPAANMPGLTLLPVSKVQGHDAYILEIKPVMPPGLKPDQQKMYQQSVKKFKQYPRFAIDKQNYTLLQGSQATTDTAVQVNLSSQVFGGSLPANTFTFTPPAGAKEFVPPKQPVGGAPGLPGGIPGGAPAPGGKPR